jgi:membrane protease YdiL (CAAX protease family)
MKKPLAIDAIGALLLNIAAIFITAFFSDALLAKYAYALLTLLLIVGYCLVSRINVREAFSMNRPSLKLFLQTIVLAVSSTALLAVLVIVQFKIYDLVGLDFSEDRKQLERAIENLSRAGFVPLFFLVAVLAPLYEEMLFRGVVLGGFKNSFSIGRAVIYSSLLFALWHISLYRIVGTFFLGVVYSLIVIYSRSIYLVIFCHMFNNGIYITLSAINIDPGRIETWNLPGVGIVVLILVLASPALFVVTLRAMYLDYKKGQAIQKG